MRYEDDDTLLGLEKAKRGQRARGGRRWTGSLGQRARASRRLPQAVFKISSYSHSAAGVWDRVNYVARDGELEVETRTGRSWRAWWSWSTWLTTGLRIRESGRRGG